MDRSARRRGLFLALFSLAGLAATACSGGDTVGATADEDGGTDESDGGTSASGDGGVNVEAQLLGTRGELGYVVTDSASGTTQAIVDQIRALPETIKLRVIF